MAVPASDLAQRAKSLDKCGHVPISAAGGVFAEGPLHRSATQALSPPSPTSAAMFRLWHCTLQCWLVCLLALVALSSAAQPASGHPSSHLSAAVRMMEAMGVREDLAAPARRWLTELQVHDPAGAERMRAFTQPFFAPDRVYGELAPFMAGLISEDACVAIARFWEGPVGRRLRESQRMLLSGTKPPPVTFSADEQRSMRAFEQSSAFAELRAATPRIEQGLRDYSRQLQERIREAGAGK